MRLGIKIAILSAIIKLNEISLDICCFLYRVYLMSEKTYSKIWIRSGKILAKCLKRFASILKECNEEAMYEECTAKINHLEQSIRG